MTREAAISWTIIAAVVLVAIIAASRPSQQPASATAEMPTAEVSLSSGTSFTAAASGKTAAARTGTPVLPGNLATSVPTQKPKPLVPLAAKASRVARGVTATGHSLAGSATWYRWRLGQAAAGPRLRAALGRYWRGKYVVVHANGRAVRLRLTDWCSCGYARIIDADSRAFAVLAPLSKGVQRVSVTW